MISKEIGIIVIIVLILIILIIKCDILHQNIKKNINNKEGSNDTIEHFMEGNFSLCDENDCDCLKLNMAPDGTCVSYKIAKKPRPEEYKNKTVGKDYVVRNNLYPKKKNSEIFIFVGNKIRNKKTTYENTPNVIKFLSDTNYVIYSEDDEVEYFLQVFQVTNDILEVFDYNEKKPYMKHMILDSANISLDRRIMKAYGIDNQEYPAFYLYNETSNKLKKFKFNKKDDRCKILQDLIIFVADGDCGLISYLNHLTDPYLGTRFLHDSKKNEWYEDDRGYQLMENGTDLCKLIDYKDLPSNFECKKTAYK